MDQTNNDALTSLKSNTLYIRPTYCVLMPTRKKGNKVFSDKQLRNMVNLKKNQSSGVISKKAKTRLINSVNWLHAAAKEKRVFCKESKRTFKFKLNFITLTLPTTDHKISDHYFKSVMLHAFINTCRYRYDLKNYVWKVEAQKNGNIHVHFTTDSFIPVIGLRRVWNRILEKNGLIDPYRNKHKSMSLKDYINEYHVIGKNDIKTLKRRYKIGCKSNWSDPNSTDVKAVHKVNDIAAYLAKYMSKNEQDKRRIKGRLWGCSHNLSVANTLSIELPVDADYNVLDTFLDSTINQKPITIKDKLSGNPVNIGELFFLKLSDWGRVIKGRVSEIFNEMLFFIRENIDPNVWLNQYSNQSEEYKYSGEVRIKRAEYIQLQLL